jgi:hypothetical protein
MHIYQESERRLQAQKAFRVTLSNFVTRLLLSLTFVLLVLLLPLSRAIALSAARGLVPVRVEGGEPGLLSSPPLQLLAAVSCFATLAATQRGPSRHRRFTAAAALRHGLAHGVPALDAAPSETSWRAGPWREKLPPVSSEPVPTGITGARVQLVADGHGWRHHPGRVLQREISARPGAGGGFIAAARRRRAMTVAEFARLVVEQR